MANAAGVADARASAVHPVFKSNHPVAESAATASGGLLVVLLAITVMTGWVLRLPEIVQIVPSFAPMQFNTALIFGICGLGLISLSLGRNGLAAGFGLTASLFAAATLAQDLLGFNLGIDELFVEAFVDVKTLHPGRMAPNTAVCFILVGFGLSISYLHGSWIGRTTAMAGNELTGLLIAGLALIAIIGYLSGTEAAYGWGEFTRMAVHTSIGFLVIGVVLAMRVWLTEGTLEGPVWIVVSLYTTIIGLELYLPLGVAIGVAYLLPVLASFWFPRPSTSYVFATLSTIFVVVGAFSSEISAAETSTILINRGMSLLAIWVTTVTVVRQKETLAARNAALEEIERVNEELEQFAYVASHDLKAPLRGIDNLAHWIEDDLEEVLEGEPKQNMGLLRGRVARMETLLDSLLEYSRAGRVPGKIVPVETNKLIHETFDFVSPPETFKLVVRGDMPRFSTARAALEQVFQNLFSNAVKHHDRPEGTITVSVKRREDWFEFSVSDDGPGIEEEFHQRIFEMFQSLKPRDEVEGSGMGLAVVKKVVESAGGMIRIDSKSGQRGTTFSFLWPREWPIPDDREFVGAA